MLCGTATTVEQLVFWRIIQGMAGGGLIPTSQLILLETFPAAEVGTGLAIWGAGLTLGPAMGPMLGGWLTDNFSWPWIFFINLPLGALCVLLALRYVPEARLAYRPRKIDTPGILLLILGIGGAQAFLERGERQGWLESPEILAYVIVSAIAIITFIWHELRCDYPIIDLRVFRNRQFAAAVPIGLMIGAVTYMVSFAFPVYLQAQLGYTSYQAGWAQLPFVLTITVSFAVLGKLSSQAWLDMRYVIATGLVLIAWSLWLSTRLTLRSGPDDFMAMQVWRGIGVAMAMLPLTTLATTSLPAHQVGVGNSLFNLARMFGGSLGIAIFTTLLEQYQHLNRGELIRHVGTFSAQAEERLRLLQQLLISHGTPPSLAPAKALQLLNSEVFNQAIMSSYNQIYFVIAMAALISVLAVALMTTGHAGAGHSATH
jgi:DHA2 family multidrug resistance protein